MKKWILLSLFCASSSFGQLINGSLTISSDLTSQGVTGFIGNGGSLSNLNASQVTSGTLPNTVLPVSNQVTGLKLTNQTSAIGTTTILTAPAGGAFYDISIYAECTTISGTGTPTLAIAINWTDDNGAQTINMISGLSLSAKGYSTGAKVASTTPTSVWIPAGSSLTYSTTIVSPAGSPQYAAYIVVKRGM